EPSAIWPATPGSANWPRFGLTSSICSVIKASKSFLIAVLSTLFVEKYRLEAATLDFILLSDPFNAAEEKGLLVFENILDKDSTVALSKSLKELIRSAAI